MIPFGTPRRHVAQCGSTNDLARAWARDPDDPAPLGALVTADFQTRGRGQRGRQWQAGWGQSALMSFVYRLPQEAEGGQLGLVAALAVADALAALADLDPRLKWPNDILLDGRKVAGILVEISLSAPMGLFGPAPPEVGAGGATLGGEAVIGIGINVNQERFVGVEKFVYSPTSLRLATGGIQEVERVVAAVASALTRQEETWRRDGFAAIVNKCRERLAVGTTVRQGGVGAELLDLTPIGAAQVRLPGGTFADWSTVD